MRTNGGDCAVGAVGCEHYDFWEYENRKNWYKHVRSDGNRANQIHRKPRQRQRHGTRPEKPPRPIHRHRRHHRHRPVPRLRQVDRADRTEHHPRVHRRGPYHVPAHARHRRNDVQRPKPAHLHQLHHPLPRPRVGQIRRLDVLDCAHPDRHDRNHSRQHLFRHILRHVRHRPQRVEMAYRTVLPCGAHRHQSHCRESVRRGGILVLHDQNHADCGSDCHRRGDAVPRFQLPGHAYRRRGTARFPVPL